MTAEMDIEGVVARWPDWLISLDGDRVHGFFWLAEPRDEVRRQTTWTGPQLRRGLRSLVFHIRPAALDTLIAQQDQLRRDMRAAGETPITGETYLDVQARIARARWVHQVGRDAAREYAEIDAMLDRIADEQPDG